MSVPGLIAQLYVNVYINGNLCFIMLMNKMCKAYVFL